MCMENMKLWYLSKRRAARAKGVPPLTFKSDGSPLTNYTIHGAAGGAGDRTDNYFYLTQEMTDPANWTPVPFSSGPGSSSYFMYFPLPAETVQILQSSDSVSASVFLRPQGAYLERLGVAIVPTMMGSAPDNYRVLQRDGTVLPYTQDMRNWDNVYLTVGYGPGIIIPSTGVDRKYEVLHSFIDNYDMSIVLGDTPPARYEPYGYKIPITCGGETVNIYLDEPLRAGDSITGSPEGIKIMTNNLMPSAAAQTIVKSGMTFSCDGKGRYTITGYNNSHTSVTFSVDLPSFTIPKSVDRHGSGTFSLWNSGVTAFTGFTWVYHMRDNLRITQILAITENITDTSYGSPGDCNGLSIQVPSGFDGSLVLCPQYTDDGVLPAEYTPYDRSIIAAIAIPTASGTNTLSVGTTVQPSSVSVSAEPDIPTSLDRYLYSRLIM